MRQPNHAPAPDPMRYLKQRGARWHYVRRVPNHLAHLDDRGLIQVSLKTSSLEVAKLRRDAMERADELFWQGAVQTDNADDAQQKAYAAAKARAVALGFEYKAAADIAASSSLEEILRRVSVAHAGTRSEETAALGAIAPPQISVRKAMEKFVDEIGVGETSGMSPYQKRKWKEIKQAAAERFIEQFGNKPLLAITRDDATAYHKAWMARVLSKDKDRISGNTANRSFGNMRKLFREYTRYISLDVRNPFDGLSFPDSKLLQTKVKPFAPEWIEKHFLVPGNLHGLNEQARLIFLALIETGCRPSELCNLLPERIVLKHKVPHLIIDFAANRVLKTENSIRLVPLVGVSLEAMKRAPNGFPNYRDKEVNFSATTMKYLKKHKLLPSPQHRVYSLRHSFEDRMKEAGLDDEFRRRMLGHDTNRPDYGDGGALAWRRDQLDKIKLRFDAGVFR